MTKYPSEHIEQVRFVAYFRKTFPGVLIYAIPNGSSRGSNKRAAMIRGAQLKAEGVTRGVPDLHVPEWGLWIEFKRVKEAKPRLSKEQKVIIAYLKETCSQSTLVAYGFEHGKAILNEFLKDVL